MPPVSKTYAHDYQLGSPQNHPDGTVTYMVTKVFSAITFDDLAPYGHPDGVVQSGQGISYFGYDSGDIYSGYTANGEPLIYAYGYPENPHLYSDATLSVGATVTFSTQASYTLCFCAGTRIRGVDGEQRVESLQIGDRLLNTAGQAVSINWIGRQRRNPLFAALHHQLPIRICAGALGDGLPTRDLYVSPDHAMLIEGCLVHASALVNGRSIEQMLHWNGDVEYFHIETANHELILAEGSATETFIDNASRRIFDNYAEFAALYPNPEPMTELDLPRICYARQLPRAIVRKLEAVAHGQNAVAA